MPPIKRVRTKVLEIAYEEAGPSPCFSAGNREFFQKNRETIEDERQSPVREQ
jgi:hypothetical protein